MTTQLHTIAFTHPNLYKDSVALMRVAQGLLALPGVVNATLQMGNLANKEILLEAGLLGTDVKNAGPNDVMVVVQARTLEQCKFAEVESKVQLAGTQKKTISNKEYVQSIEPTNLAMGMQAFSGRNLAQISVPGVYAGSEALKAVKLGLHVFMFSDNVPLEQEITVKKEAYKRGVLVMGPDCGTAIIAGVPLGFANEIRAGTIGLVAASGTGLQEVSTQIHRMGGGISHAIGTGGRDVYEEVGGITMLQGIELLVKDANTKVIVIVSKPPALSVAEKVIAALRFAGKPSVVLFLGQELQGVSHKTSKAIYFTNTLVDCAAIAVKLSGIKTIASKAYMLPSRPIFSKSQRYIRALYSGGTFAAEAQILWAREGLKIWSNVPLDKKFNLRNPSKESFQHTALDLGEDAFTVGRPHPMIDQATRIDRLMQEATDPSVRVVVLDVVIGWGAHSNPSDKLGKAIVKAKKIAKKGGRNLGVVGFVCGTEADPQVLSVQESILRGAGMALAANSANAAWLASQWVK